MLIQGGAHRVKTWLWVPLVALPVALCGPWLGLAPGTIFAAAAVSLAGLSAVLGETLAAWSLVRGPRLGGILNALLGSATLLSLGCFALWDGRFTLIKASLTGAFLSHLVLGLGLSIFLGGLRHGSQYFSRVGANIAATMLVLTVIALAVPAMYGRLTPLRNTGPVESLSEAVAAVMIGVFLLSRYYHLFWSDEPVPAALVIPRGAAPAAWPTLTVVLLLVLAAIAGLSAVLVRAMPAVIAASGLNERFIGIAVFPLVSNAAVLQVAVRTAWRNRMDVSLAISTEASLQVALWVAPLLVFVSLIVGRPMDLIFSPIELAAMAAAAAMAALVEIDGESNWIEGIMLMAVYLLIGLAFFWWPLG